MSFFLENVEIEIPYVSLREKPFSRWRNKYLIKISQKHGTSTIIYIILFLSCKEAERIRWKFENSMELLFFGKIKHLWDTIYKRVWMRIFYLKMENLCYFNLSKSFFSYMLDLSLLSEIKQALLQPPKSTLRIKTLNNATRTDVIR